MKTKLTELTQATFDCTGCDVDKFVDEIIDLQLGQLENQVNNLATAMQLQTCSLNSMYSAIQRRPNE